MLAECSLDAHFAKTTRQKQLARKVLSMFIDITSLKTRVYLVLDIQTTSGPVLVGVFHYRCTVRVTSAD